MKATDNTYLFRVDHLRFFAALLVIVWHFSHIPGMVPTAHVPHGLLLNIFEEGHTGVALFLVISGFIFEYVSFGREIIYKKFIYNRILRIFPLFIIFTLYTIYITNLANPTTVAINMLTFIDPKTLPSVGWTIAVEFQFYLIFPFLHSILTKKGPLNIFMILCFFFALRIITFFNWETVQELSYTTIFGRIDQFIIGMLTAYFYRKYVADKFNSLKLIMRYVISLVIMTVGILGISLFYRRFNCMGGFYDMATYPSKSSIWIYLTTVEGLCYASWLVGYLLFPVNFLKYFDWFMGKMGELSYSMYWIHFPIAYLVFGLGFKTTSFNTAFLYSTVVVTPIVVVLSLLSYHFIEKPFLEKRVKYFS